METKIRRCLGVGDFDTSDLPFGHRPTNEAYYRDLPETRRGTRGRNIQTSTRFSRILNTTVERYNEQLPNGYEVTFNRHGKDDTKLQVFIDNNQLDIHTVGYVDREGLTAYVNRAIRGG